MVDRSEWLKSLMLPFVELVLTVLKNSISNSSLVYMRGKNPVELFNHDHLGNTNSINILAICPSSKVLTDPSICLLHVFLSLAIPFPNPITHTHLPFSSFYCLTGCPVPSVPATSIVKTPPTSVSCN